MSFGAFFLQEPDLFPGRCSGERWGADEVRLDIAGGPYRLEGLSLAQASVLRRELAPRCLDPGPPGGDFSIAIYRAPEGDFRSFPVQGWTTSFDLDSLPTAVRIAGRRFMARVEMGSSAALWTSSDGDADFHGLAENFLRVVVAHRALDAGGVLLHSAAVVRDGRAFVFFGPSGAGKSTLSGLSAARGYEVLSDELNALFEDQEGYVVERLPFAGDFGRSSGERRRFPLAGIFRLTQGIPAARTALSGARALGALLAAAPFVNNDDLRSERLSGNLERLVRRVRPETLRFSLDPGFWDILPS